MSFQISVFVFFGGMPRSGITGLYGMSVFSFCKDSPCCLSQPANLHSSLQCIRSPLSPSTLLHLLPPFCFVSTDHFHKCDLIIQQVILICLSQLMSTIDQFSCAYWSSVFFISLIRIILARFLRGKRVQMEK